MIVYVSHRAYSSAALYSLAGDFIVMDERAASGLHGSMLRDAGTDPEEAAYLARMRELDGAAYASRTHLPPEGAAWFLNTPGGTLEKPAGKFLLPDVACALGSSTSSTAAEWRRISPRLARGEAVSSPRQDALAKRPVSPAVLDLEAAMRAEAAVYEREAMQGEV